MPNIAETIAPQPFRANRLPEAHATSAGLTSVPLVGKLRHPHRLRRNVKSIRTVRPAKFAKMASASMHLLRHSISWRLSCSSFSSHSHSLLRVDYSDQRKQEKSQRPVPVSQLPSASHAAH